MIITFEGEVYTENEAQIFFNEIASNRMEEINNEIKEILENDDSIMMELAQEYCRYTESEDALITYNIYDLVADRAGDTDAIVNLIEDIVNGDVYDATSTLRYANTGYLENVDEEGLTETAQTYIDEITAELIRGNMSTGNYDIVWLVDEYDEIENMEDLEDWADYYEKQIVLH